MALVCIADPVLDTRTTSAQCAQWTHPTAPSIARPSHSPSKYYVVGIRMRPQARQLGAVAVVALLAGWCACVAAFGPAPPSEQNCTVTREVGCYVDQLSHRTLRIQVAIRNTDMTKEVGTR